MRKYELNEIIGAFFNIDAFFPLTPFNKFTLNDTRAINSII